MLSEEEKEAIERLEKRIKDNEDYKTTQVWLTDDIVAVDTVLNLITKLQKENEEKDKQIDLMAENIELQQYANIDTSNLDLVCEKLDCNKKCKLVKKNCIKQYFERKVEDVKN